ncbi:unnamed protein product, partial [marine sediment metagenome]
NKSSKTTIYYRLLLVIAADFVTSLFLARERNVTSFDSDLAGGDPEHVAGDIDLL